MKTFHLKYENRDELYSFIDKNGLKGNSSILLQIFTGICDLDYIQELVSTIREVIPHIKIIGTTTDGEIMNATISEFSTILSFSIFQKTKVLTHYVENLEDSGMTAKKLIEKFDKSKRAKVAISFTDGLHINGEDYVNVFSSYDKDLIIAGGHAGDNAKFLQTIVFNEEKVLTNGCVIALLYNDELEVKTEANFGWSKIGKNLTITKSNLNIVYEIDGVKAYDIYKKYLGEDIAQELPSTGIEFPLIINRNGMSIARAVIGKNDDGSLIFAGNLNIGDIVTFGYGNIETILQGGDEVYKSVASSPSESIFIYSCMARKALMGDSIKAELEQLDHISPISGFFTYGEFYNNSSNNELLNQTMTILSLSESSNIPVTSNLKSVYKSTSNKTLKALSHLIMQTSMELEEINERQELKIKEEVNKNRQKDQQLFQQSRLAQMGEMISMIAHQWRQPLAAISATSNNLIFKLMMDDIDKELFESEIEHISNYSQHLSKTIDDFRNFFKEDKESQIISLQKVIDDTLCISKVSLENKNIELITKFDDCKDIQTYPNELKQVVLNLIKNAEDALLENMVKEPKIFVELTQEGDYSVIRVNDNAGGISENIINRVFEPYFSTKLEKDGTGLGLYMSKIMIEEHCNGRLELTNNDKGALFSIKIKSLQE